jgi:hypothetical protein
MMEPTWDDITENLAERLWWQATCGTTKCSFSEIRQPFSKHRDIARGQGKTSVFEWSVSIDDRQSVLIQRKFPRDCRLLP